MLEYTFPFLGFGWNAVFTDKCIEVLKIFWQRWPTNTLMVVAIIVLAIILIVVLKKTFKGVE